MTTCVGVGRLSRLFDEGEVVIHPFVIGELACGNLKNRSEILTLLGELPEASRVRDSEVLLFLEHHKLAGCGRGLVDVRLLASCRLDSLPIWTKDARLKSTANRIGLAVE